MTSILAVRLGALGDLLTVLPSLNLLRRAYPGARIVLRCRPDGGALLRAREVVDEVRSADAVERGGEPFDLRLGWFQKPGSIPEVPGRSFVFDPSAGRTVGRFFFDRTAAFIRESSARPLPDFDACVRLPGARPGRRTGPAVIHPGSGGRRKRWPLDSFLALAADLGRRGLAGRFVVGEADADIAPRVREEALPSGWTVLESPALPDLAVLLESAPLYVGNDSGITHLAVACGAPAVALFRSEFAAAWRPSGPAAVLSGDAVEEIPLKAVIAAAAASASGRLVISWPGNREND